MEHSDRYEQPAYPPGATVPQDFDIQEEVCGTVVPYPGVTPKLFDVNQGTADNCVPASYNYGSNATEAENETGTMEGY